MYLTLVVTINYAQNSFIKLTIGINFGRKLFRQNCILKFWTNFHQKEHI
jgi:hypothetical protein